MSKNNGMESPIENQLYEALLKRFSPEEFVLQYQINGYRVDFAFPEYKLVVEADGHEFHSTKKQLANDHKRDRVLYTLGWKVMRFTGSEIHKDAYSCASEISDMVTMIRKSLEPRPKVLARFYDLNFVSVGEFSREWAVDGVERIDVESWEGGVMCIYIYEPFVGYPMITSMPVMMSPKIGTPLFDRN